MGIGKLTFSFKSASETGLLGRAAMGAGGEMVVSGILATWFPGTVVISFELSRWRRRAIGIPRCLLRADW